MFEGKSWTFQLKKRADLAFLHVFVLFRPPMDWMVDGLLGEGNLDLLY